MNLSYATYNDLFNRIKTADLAVDPNGHGHPGWIQAVMGGLIDAIAGGWMPANANAAAMTAALPADANGYLRWLVGQSLQAGVGKTLGSQLVDRAMAALSKMLTGLTPADDGFVASVQAVTISA